jgi:type I restriction enzyme, R subunit
MTVIGEAEKETQRRVVRLFVGKLHYDYLGNLSEGDNHNVREGELEHFLFAYQGYAEREDGDPLMRRAVAELVKVAGNTSLSLYDRNKKVYELLRYGVKVKADVAAKHDVMKSRRVRRAIEDVLGEGEERVERILGLAKSQNDY